MKKNFYSGCLMLGVFLASTLFFWESASADEGVKTVVYTCNDPKKVRPIGNENGILLPFGETVQNSPSINFNSTFPIFIPNIRNQKAENQLKAGVYAYDDMMNVAVFRCSYSLGDFYVFLPSYHKICTLSDQHGVINDPSNGTPQFSLCDISNKPDGSSSGTDCQIQCQIGD